MNKCSFKIYSEKTNIAIIYDKDMFKTCFYVYHIALFHQITLHQEKRIILLIAIIHKYLLRLVFDGFS